MSGPFTLLDARTIEGHDAKTRPALFAALARAFAFPDGWGENWDAVHDLLRDLSWLPPAEEHVVLLRDANWVLADEGEEQLKVFVDVLRSVARHWAGEDTEARGGGPARPATFRAVLHAEPTERDVLVARYRAAGADV